MVLDIQRKVTVVAFHRDGMYADINVLFLTSENDIFRDNL